MFDRADVVQSGPGEVCRFCAPIATIPDVFRAPIFAIYSYQTAAGVVTGIQWVPAEATNILPAGAQPASDASQSMLIHACRLNHV